MDKEAGAVDAQKTEMNFESKNFFKASAEGETRFRQIVDMLFDGILIIQNGVIIETNHGLLSMTGYEASELIGHKIEELDGWKDLGISLAAVSV